MEALLLSSKYIRDQSKELEEYARSQLQVRGDATNEYGMISGNQSVLPVSAQQTDLGSRSQKKSNADLVLEANLGNEAESDYLPKEVKPPSPGTKKLTILLKKEQDQEVVTDNENET